nr:MAG: ORF2 [Torque teno polar bear virus 22]
MLPVHRKWMMDFKKKEAIWKRSVSDSHKLFCSCPSYLSHFTKCPTDGGAGVVGADVSLGEGISFVTETDGGDKEDGGPGTGETPR